MERRVIGSRTMRAGAAGALALLFLGGVTAFGAVGGTPLASSPSAEQSGKQTLCHRTGSRRNPWRTVTVGQAAVPAHLRHGDTLGACATTTSTTTTTTASTPTTTTTTTATTPESAPKEKKPKDRPRGNGRGNA